MNICIITENFSPKIGGGELLMFEIANRISNKGHDVRVVTSCYNNAPRHEQNGNLEIYRHKWPKIFNHSIPRLKDLREHVAWSDIVHTTTYTTAHSSHKLAQKYNKPCVISVYESLGDKWFWITNPITAYALKTYEKRVITGKFALWHSISKSTKNDLIKLGIPENKIFIAYPGVERLKVTQDSGTLAKLFGIDNKHNVFLYFGRCGKTKGWDILLKAIKNIKADIPENFCFAFLADRPGAVNALAEKLGIDKIIYAHKSVSRQDLPAYIKSAYSVIVPSLTEGFGFSAAETCTLGIPIIASNAGSLPEVVSGKYLLFKNRSIDNLSKKILMAIKNNFEYKDPPKFDWDNSTNKIISLYNKAIEKY